MVDSNPQPYAESMKQDPEAIKLEKELEEQCKDEVIVESKEIVLPTLSDSKL